MGLINLDNYVCANGVQKTNTYISFANETLYIRQAFNANATEATYTVNANYRIFWDQAAREANLSFIDLKSVSANIPKSMLNENMYACLYEELKKVYPNTQDEVSRVAPAPVAPAPVVPVAPVAPAPVAPVAPVEPVVPVAPVAPVAPVEPVAPVVPVAPVEPVAPVVPVAPVAPVAPVEPVAPVAPVEPVAPVAPVEPVAPVAPVEPVAPQ